MKLLLSLITIPSCALVLASCEANLKSAPPVTAGFIKAATPKNADGATLAEGRKVFVNRCIQCHALPDVAQYRSDRIPGIVNWMSHRAHLTAEQKEALTKYLQTVRAQL